MLLEALVYLHANGIVHGACLPSNIVFSTSSGVPGWVHSARLAFFYVDNDRCASSFTDLQDVAYTICAIMRRRVGALPRSSFHPSDLKRKDWDHLSGNMYSCCAFFHVVLMTG